MVWLLDETKKHLALETRYEPLAFISWDSYLLGVSIKKGLIKQIRPDQAYVVSKARKRNRMREKKGPLPTNHNRRSSQTAYLITLCKIDW